MRLELNFLNSIILLSATMKPTNWVIQVEKEIS